MIVNEHTSKDEWHKVYYDFFCSCLELQTYSSKTLKTTLVYLVNQVESFKGLISDEDNDNK